MDASFCKVHADGQGGRKDGPERLIGRTKGGMNTKLHATVDARKRPVKLHLTARTCADVIAEHVLPIGRRHRVENFFADLKRSRRIAMG